MSKPTVHRAAPEYAEGACIELDLFNTMSEGDELEAAGAIRGINFAAEMERSYSYLKGFAEAFVQECYARDKVGSGKVVNVLIRALEKARKVELKRRALIFNAHQHGKDSQEDPTGHFHRDIIE